MIKRRCLLCNYLHITVIIWKCARLISSPRRSVVLTHPVSALGLPPRLHADFDIAEESIDPEHRNASRSDYNEDSRSFNMLMDNFT